MHYDDVKKPNVLQRRVGRVEMMPLLEGLVTYSMMLKDQDIEEVKRKLAAFVGCRKREAGKSNCFLESRKMKQTEVRMTKKTSGPCNQMPTSALPWKERLIRTI
jgi:hypothetical protein